MKHTHSTHPLTHSKMKITTPKNTHTLFTATNSHSHIQKWNPQHSKNVHTHSKILRTQKWKHTLHRTQKWKHTHTKL